MSRLTKEQDKRKKKLAKKLKGGKDIDNPVSLDASLDKKKTKKKE